MPSFHDPFAGGGAIPLEGQRLGLKSFASDLNPVAVLINKAMIEFPPRYKDLPPINEESQSQRNQMDRRWHGSEGLADDLNYYAKWMLSRAEEKIGHLYPQIAITEEIISERPELKKYLGRKLTVISWMWARTVSSPNPAFSHVDVPLASTFLLNAKPGKEKYIEPVINGDKYFFTVKNGRPSQYESVKHGTKVGRGGHFQCLISGTPISVTYIREQGIQGKFGSRLMAIVLDGDSERVYLAPDELNEQIANSMKPNWIPDQEINHNPRDIRTQLYGLTKYSDLFTQRQLVALNVFSDLVVEAHHKINNDFLNIENKLDLTQKKQYKQYSDAIATYLGIVVSKLTDYNSTGCSWGSNRESIRNTFGRQALPIVWDYIEANPLSTSTGSFKSVVDQVYRVIKTLPANSYGEVTQFDAQKQTISKDKIISTDPPYYDNIGYADLSDFFYVWLRRCLKNIIPELFSTLTVPKLEELVATPYRHGSKSKAEDFFLDGMSLAMHQISSQSHPAFPVTIYYAFKQTENDEKDGTTNTGWDTFLAAVIDAGFSITGTWPIRTEMNTRMISSGTNALASSIVLVCRHKDEDAESVTRREFVAALKKELPVALKFLQAGNIAPVDLAQAAIGPGMAVFTRFTSVLDAEGNALSVRSALALINQILDESLAEQEGDFDAESRWALTWFEQYGFIEGDYGVAEQLSKSKNTGINKLVDIGILSSRAGKVRLLKPMEMNPDWMPVKGQRISAWEMVHHLIRALLVDGEAGAAELVTKLGSQSEVGRELCYRLFSISERKKRSVDAIAYNSLVQSWPEILRISKDLSELNPTPTNDLFDQE